MLTMTIPRPLSRFSFALAVAALSCGLCRAQPVAAKNPCSDASSLQTRADILAAVPENDSDWRQILGKRGIHKTENGEWMQYDLGGEISASNKAFVAAFGDYCSARAVAASRGAKAAAKMGSTPQLDPAEEDAERRRQMDYKAKMKRARERTLWATGPSPEPSVCSPQFCEAAQSCADAGVGDNNLGSDFRCRKAFKDTSNCTCP
jgi:hypothetical protein